MQAEPRTEARIGSQNGRCGRRRRAAVTIALAAPLWLIGATAQAQQFVLFDATFTYTKADADNATPNKSHYYVTSKNAQNPINPQRPTDWTAPIDYRNGTVHLRTEVLDKPPGSEITQWWICYIANKGVAGTSGYGCTGTGTYKEKGVYEHDESMTAWWNNKAIDWTQGIRQADLIMKDFGTGNGGNYAHLRPDPEHFFPTRMRITLIQVAAGATYDPKLIPSLPPALADAGAAADTGTGGTSDMGTGGVAGTGGVTGAGGVIGTGDGSVTGTGNGSQPGSGGSAAGGAGGGGSTTSPTGGAGGRSDTAGGNGTPSGGTTGQATTPPRSPVMPARGACSYDGARDVRSTRGGSAALTLLMVALAIRRRARSMRGSAPARPR